MAESIFSPASKNDLKTFKNQNKPKQKLEIKFDFISENRNPSIYEIEHFVIMDPRLVSKKDNIYIIFTVSQMIQSQFRLVAKLKLQKSEIKEVLEAQKKYSEKR